MSYLNYKAVLALPKQPALPRHIKLDVSSELFGALYMYISVLLQKPNQTFFMKYFIFQHIRPINKIFWLHQTAEISILLGVLNFAIEVGLY